MTPDISPNQELLATPGVHPLPPHALPALLHAAHTAGMRPYCIDLSACDDKAAVLAALAKGLSFPAWFGHNWDALADCLSDLSWLPDRSVVVVFEHVRRLADNAPDDYRTTLDIFAEAAESQAAQGRRLMLFTPCCPPRRSDRSPPA
ncbi:barstar family protein [Pseudothauera hydrothermalis]|uniref:barstar family protein n=1 Tax=Pseudothauera hydrothermalis TaxID=2184083 RepID=UPI001F246B9D|nr:barstar family protein [Pseudothauera hydrothermalis]